MTIDPSKSAPSLVGYQTSLVVYGPGGYTFTDFPRVGASLQQQLTVATALGIAFSRML